MKRCYSILLLLLALTVRCELYSSSVTLAWDPSPDAAAVGYKVYWGPASQNYTNSVDAGAATNVTIRLEAGTLYYFAATAYNQAHLEGPFSNEISYTTPIIPPPRPGTNTAVVSATIEMSKDGTNWVTIGTVSLTSIPTSPALYRSLVKIQTPAPPPSASATRRPLKKLATPKGMEAPPLPGKPHA